jgi:hypothetical protein
MSKRLIPKIAITLLLTLTVLVASYHAFDWVLEKAFLSLMCGNTIRAESNSPDGKFKAVVFGRSCGATTSVGTYISILREGKNLPNENGNICAMSGLPEVELRWAGNNELIIYNRGAQLYGPVQSFDGINIRYED